ncbi:MAG: type II toxin-antitoxin system Phd/YefM family antitoxin [Caldilineaceae bacterium]
MTIKTYHEEEVRLLIRTVLDDILTSEAEAIIERNGKPTAVVISYKRWQQIEQEKAQKRQHLAEARTQMATDDDLALEQAQSAETLQQSQNNLSSLEELVAEIRRMGPNPNNITPGSGRLAEKLAHPLTEIDPTFDLEEWTREWDRIEAEMNTDPTPTRATT